MDNLIDAMFEQDPKEWILALPDYQRGPIVELIENGNSFEDVAQRWVTATAVNTYRLGAAGSTGDKSTFLLRVKAEVRAYLCGDKRYKQERDGLFGQKGLARTYIVTGIAVAIAPHLGVAAPVLAPVIALVLASLGKITVNAWCASTEAAASCNKSDVSEKS
jgi:hypothetical protein